MWNPLNRSGACLAVIAAMLTVVPVAVAQRRGRRLQNADSVPIRERPSKNFHVVTDLSEEDLGELLGRLERMLRLVSAYFGRPNPGKIQMYVIDDFDNWPDELLGTMDSDGIEAVRRGGGLTITEVVRNQANGRFVSRATVYAGTDHGTPQHEAVHGCCGLAFGELGPGWQLLVGTVRRTAQHLQHNVVLAGSRCAGTGQWRCQGIDLIVQRRLIELRQEKGGVAVTVEAVLGEESELGVVVLERRSELVEMVLALGASGGFAGVLNRRHYDSQQ